MSDVKQNDITIASTITLDDFATGLAGGNSKNIQLRKIKGVFDSLVINPKAANYTIQATDIGSVIEMNSASPVTITVPTGLPEGFNCAIFNIGTGGITFTPAAGVSLLGVTGLPNQNSSAVIYKRTGVNEFGVFSGGAAIGGSTGGGGSSDPITPAAPTSGVVDDTANTFDWTHPSGYTTADEETTINGGSTWVAAVKPLSVGNVNKATGQVGVRVKAATGRNVSATLFNTTAFTLTSPGTPVAITGTNKDSDVSKTGTVWASSSTDAAFGHRAVSDLKMPAGGTSRFWFKANSNNAIIGVRFDQVLGGYSTFFSFLWLQNTGTIAVKDASAIADTGIHYTAGLYYSFRRAADGTFYIESSSDLTTWANVYTYTSVGSNVDLWICMDIAGASTSVIEALDATNLV